MQFQKCSNIKNIQYAFQMINIIVNWSFVTANTNPVWKHYTHFYVHHFSEFTFIIIKNTHLKYSFIRLGSPNLVCWFIYGTNNLINSFVKIYITKIKKKELKNRSNVLCHKMHVLRINNCIATNHNQQSLVILPKDHSPFCMYMGLWDYERY